MEKPNAKKRYFNYKRDWIASRIALTLDKSKSYAPLNSVYREKVNSGPAWTRTICNKLALSKSIMAKPGQNIFQNSSYCLPGTRMKQWHLKDFLENITTLSQTLGRLNVIYDPLTLKVFSVVTKARFAAKILSLRKLTEWRTVTTGVLLSDSLHGRIGQRKMSMVI